MRKASQQTNPTRRAAIEREKREKLKAQASRTVNPLNGTTSDPLPAAYSPEQLAQKQAAFEDVGSFVQIIKDEWYNQIEVGDPFKEAARPYQQANPDLHMRYLSPAVMARRGTRGYAPIRDPQGKAVVVSGQELRCIPKTVKERRDREKDQAATSAIETIKNDYRDQVNDAARELGSKALAKMADSEL